MSDLSVMCGIIYFVLDNTVSYILSSYTGTVSLGTVSTGLAIMWGYDDIVVEALIDYE